MADDNIRSSAAAPRTHIVFAEKDRGLRDDVRLLGELVGELVQEQGGEALFDLVEAARRAAISRREGDASGYEELQDLISALAPGSARDFIRAFSTYFQMVNIAEQVHRIRRRREYLTDQSRRQPFGFADVLGRLRESGVTLDQVEALLAGICIEPVFAAQLSEVSRRTLLRKQQSIARHLIEMLDPYLNPLEVEATIGQIRMDMATGWQTAEHALIERQLSDDAEQVLFFLTDVLYRMIPPFYEALEQALREVYAEDYRRIAMPEIVRFASRVGGDMDGNITVNSKSIRGILARQRSLVLDLYYRECQTLSGHLSQTEGRSTFSPEIGARIEEYRGHFPAAVYSVATRHQQMPYRVLLRLIQARLQATYDDAAFPYESAEEFIADLELIADSLRANLGRNAGLFAVKRLLRRAETFRFHLASVELRQSAAVHRRTLAEALEDRRWGERPAAERCRMIAEALERRVSPALTLSSEARRTLSVFQMISQCRRRYGERAIARYTVSGIENADDILSMLLLCRWGNPGARGGGVPIDITPVFSTTAELERAALVMQTLLIDESYRKHLQLRDNRQYVALSYASANMAGDAVSARWMLDKTHRELDLVFSKAGVELIVIHGRGGPFNRPAGPVHEALSAMPETATARHLLLTEQGEAIPRRYGLRGIAMRSLEQLASGLLLRESGLRTAEGGAPWNSLMAELAAASGAAFAALVHAEGFADYFRLATPIDVIERLEESQRTPELDARIVAGVHGDFWVMAWAQNRCFLAGWYGFGAALSAVCDTHGVETLKQMLEQWPAFRQLVADIEFALAKTDLDVTEQYSLLAGDAHALFFPRIRHEFDRSVSCLLQLTGQTELLADSRTMARSIKLRNPYVDPMSFLQVNLLKKWRAGGSGANTLLQALLASVNGIAHAVQDTG